MSLNKNVIANFSGTFWRILMSVAFVPFYVNIMGPESYGIVGIYASLTGMLAVMDLGLSQAMNRQMARLSHDEQNNQKINNTARTLEIIYWAIAAIMGAIVLLLARPIAASWLNPDQLTVADIQFAIQIIGVVIALRWPVSLYMGGLNGLQRQVTVNVLQIITATVQAVGALAVLLFIDPTIKAFFIWQGVMGFVVVMALRRALWKALPARINGVWDRSVLAEIWRFSAGISGITLLATILTQLDKVILSKILPLTDFGYYTFASTVAVSVLRLVGPVFTAYYPRLTQLVAQSDRVSLSTTYHQGSQLMAITIFPVAIFIVFFSKEILLIWTNNPDLVANASLLVSLLVIGNMLNGVMHFPYALQLAHGWTKLAFYQNCIAVIVLAPAIYFSTIHWGAVGAASCWIALNTLYLLVGNQVMHLRLLPTEKWQWYYHDFLKPLAFVVGVCTIFQLILESVTDKLMIMLILFSALFCAFSVAVLSCSKIRGSIEKRARNFLSA